MGQLFSLISSLPALRLFETPAVTSEKFLEFCSAFVHGRRMALLERISLIPGLRRSETKPLVPQGAEEISGQKLDSSGSVYDLAFRSFESDVIRSFPRHSVAFAYTKWELALRNSIAKIRASKWDRGDAGPSTRIDGGYEADADRVVLQAFAAPNPMERERILDRARWDKLDEYARIFNLHMFSFDALCAYSLKLQIAEKWANCGNAQANENLDRAALSVRTRMESQN